MWEDDRDIGGEVAFVSEGEGRGWPSRDLKRREVLKRGEEFCNPAFMPYRAS